MALTAPVAPSEFLMLVSVRSATGSMAVIWPLAAARSSTLTRRVSPLTAYGNQPSSTSSTNVVRVRVKLFGKRSSS